MKQTHYTFILNVMEKNYLNPTRRGSVRFDIKYVHWC